MHRDSTHILVVVGHGFLLLGVPGILYATGHILHDTGQQPHHSRCIPAPRLFHLVLNVGDDGVARDGNFVHGN